MIIIIIIVVIIIIIIIIIGITTTTQRLKSVSNFRLVGLKNNSLCRHTCLWISYIRGSRTLSLYLIME